MVGPLTPIHSATCAICVAMDEGIDLTPEDIRNLRMTKVNGVVMSLAAAYPDRSAEQVTALQATEEAKISMVGHYMKATVRIVQAAKAALVQTVSDSKKSKSLAKEKRRPRVFDLPIDYPTVEKQEIE